MIQYDPKTDLRHYPGIDMSIYGQNPYGENLFRIVFSASRRSLVCGTFADGSTGGRWMHLYAHLGPLWILERWLSPHAFTGGMTREKWDQTMSINGPFPDRGEYDLCHAFEACDPTQANLDKLIMWINEGKNRRFDEIRSACADVYAQEDKDTGNMQDAVIRDALPAFGAAPMIGPGGGRGTKTGLILRSANELGLPTRPGVSA